MDWTIRYGGGHEGHLALNPLGLAGGQEEWCWAGTGRNLFTCTVEYSLAAALDKLLRPPFFDRQLQGTKAPLHPTEADGQAVFKREVLRMVREHRSVHSGTGDASQELFAHGQSGHQYHLTTSP